MFAGELQAWNWAINGRARRSYFIFFSYSLREALKMGWKLEGKEANLRQKLLDKSQSADGESGVVLQ